MKTQVLTLILFLGASLATAQQDRLNFIFLIGDDINRDQLATYGGPAKTPHLDQLAKDGIRFDRAYGNVAMCAPFRQELYSGRVTWRTRSMLNHSHSVQGTSSVIQHLKKLDYRVGLLGKSHVGPHEAYPFEKVQADTNAKVDNNDELVRATKAFTASAKDQGKPFCLFVASNDGHAPFTTGDPSQYDPEKLKVPPYWKDTARLRTELVKHMAEITNLDACLGRIREHLKKEGIEKNTVLIFCSEQGAQFPFGKWTCYDNGLHTGIVAACPGTIPAGAVAERILWIADIAPTFVEAAGGKFAESDFDGKSQWANFKGANEKVHDFSYGAFSNKGIIDNRERVYPIRVVRDERWSLIWSPAHEGKTSNVTLSRALGMIEQDRKPKDHDPASSWVAAAQKESDKPLSDPLVKQLHERPEWALYDLENDPYELKNLAADPAQAETLKRLQGQLDQWLGKWEDSDPIATEKALTTNHRGGGKKNKKTPEKKPEAK